MKNRCEHVQSPESARDHIWNIESSNSESENERACAMTSNLETEQACVIESSIPESNFDASTTSSLLSPLLSPQLLLKNNIIGTSQKKNKE